MARKRWWRRLLDRWNKRARKLVARDRPLREFVYLDEVSLTSLLVSQRDTIPEHVTSGRSVSEQAEVSVKASVDAVAAKAESATRYQTANSSSVESSRKAVVQTLFNELRDDENLPIWLLDDATGPALLQQDAATPGGPGVSGWGADDLRRGQLIEVEVVLEVDPVFRLGTMVSEFSAMAAEYPQMAGPSGLAMLSDIDPVKKVLDRLLAGLIPIRARASHLSVVTSDGQDYVVQSSAAAGLGLPVHPLEVVGVTEHIGYWKDIRRVLFSSAQFKLLCRVARPGLHETWTPVKVAHLFGDIAPTLVEQIEAIGMAGTSGLTGLPAGRSQLTLLRALAAYADEIAPTTSGDHEPARATDLIEIAARVADESSPSAQRRAFAEVRALLVDRNSGHAILPEKDLTARQNARAHAGLAVFPSGALDNSASHEAEAITADSVRRNEAKLIDVEVVAIYW